MGNFGDFSLIYSLFTPLRGQYGSEMYLYELAAYMFAIYSSIPTK